MRIAAAIRPCWIMEKSMRRVLAGLVLGIPLAVFGAAGAQDDSFFRAAAQGGIAEVENGRLAQDHGGSNQVQEFGAMVEKDNLIANEKLKKIAEAESVTLPSRKTESQVSTYQKLTQLSGASFDRSYMQGQIRAHEETIALFKQEIAKGQDAQAKRFATDRLPVIESHLEKARSIYAGLGH
jgi:putative membrane protein